MKQQTTKQHNEFRDKLKLNMLIVQQTIIDKRLIAVCTAGWGRFVKGSAVYQVGLRDVLVNYIG